MSLNESNSVMTNFSRLLPSVEGQIYKIYQSHYSFHILTVLNFSPWENYGNLEEPYSQLE